MCVCCRPNASGNSLHAEVVLEQCGVFCSLLLHPSSKLIFETFPNEIDQNDHNILDRTSVGLRAGSFFLGLRLGSYLYCNTSGKLVFKT